MKTGHPWVWRIAVAVVAGAVLTRMLRSATGSRSGAEFLPPIVSDTWPPVPTNPDRSR
jgi:hypothetical protein